jgi:hypothetical protein
LALHLTPIGNDPQHSEERHAGNGEAGDDGVRHGSSHEISRSVGGGPVSGSTGTVACHANVIPASVDPARAVATGIASQTTNSNILTDQPGSADKSPLTAAENGIVAETCPACRGSARSYHFGHLVCGVCKGSGVAPVDPPRSRAVRPQSLAREAYCAAWAVKQSLR